MKKVIIRTLPNPDALRNPCHELCLAGKQAVMVFKKGKRGEMEEKEVDRNECSSVFTLDDGTKVCEKYAFPSSWMNRGDCPAADNIVHDVKGTLWVNPLKASKKKSRRA